MPYLPITLPSRGLHVDSAYSSLPPGFTLDSINVLPYDPYKGKQRLGQRRALLGAFEFNDTSPSVVTRKVQAIVRADAYVVAVGGTTELTQRCVVVAGGEVYIIDPGDTVPTIIAYASSTSKLDDTKDISVAIFGNYAYFADGEKYRRMNITLATNDMRVEFWGTVLSNVTLNNAGHIIFTATPLRIGDPIVITGSFAAGGGQGTISGYSFQQTVYVKQLVGTANTEVHLSATYDGATFGANLTTTSGTTNGLTFIISGPEMTIKPSSNASSIGKAGAEAGERASLLVRFGGRLALSGFTPSPNNWFLSKINDVDDWVPGSTPDDAVAGNLSTKFSIPGEPIVALIPMAESGLLFAGRHTMTYLSADPVFDTQARMIELSRSVGIVSAKAWCVSDAQTVYIMAQDGLYRVRPNEFQVTQSGRITGGRLDSFFQSQKFDKLNCSLGFDPEIQNIYCILSRTDLPSSSTHLVYSQATDSFWAIRTGWTAFQAPSCIGEFPFGDARSPVLALGSEDGYLGWFDRNLTSGVDGQAAVGYKGGSSPFTVNNLQAAAQKIVSSLTIGPVVSPNLSQVMLRDMRIELTMDEPQEVVDFNTPNVRLTGPFLSILSGQTAEEAIGEAIVNVTVRYDPSFPAVVLDGGDASVIPRVEDPVGGYDFGVPVFVGTTGINLAYPQSLAPHTYTTLDTLITDPTARTYAFGDNRIYNTGSPPSNGWKIQNEVNVGNIQTLFTRDESLPGTSLDTPGGVYVYGDGIPTALPLPTLPGSSQSPRIVVSSGTYTNTNSIQIGELQSGRNDALRCRIRDQAVFARIDSNGVPWAIERMAALIDPMTHTKNVKGTY
jgi:hypothetical protein